MNKVSKQLKIILEYIWLTTAVIAIVVAIYDTYINSFKSALPFYGFFFLALFFFHSRRRERLSKNQ